MSKKNPKEPHRTTTRKTNLDHIYLFSEYSDSEKGMMHRFIWAKNELQAWDIAECLASAGNYYVVVEVKDILGSQLLDQMVFGNFNEMSIAPQYREWFTKKNTKFDTFAEDDEDDDEGDRLQPK